MKSSIMTKTTYFKLINTRHFKSSLYQWVNCYKMV